MQVDTVYRQELHSSTHYILCICNTDTMYKQVVGIYMHACMQIDHRQLWELTINYTLASHTLSTKSVASESTYNVLIGIYNIFFYVQQ